MLEIRERSRVKAMAVSRSIGALGCLDPEDRFMVETGAVPELPPLGDLATEAPELKFLLDSEESERDCVAGIRIPGILFDLDLELVELVDKLLCILFLDTPLDPSVMPVERPRFGVKVVREGCELDRLDTDVEAFRLGADELTSGDGVVDRVLE